MTRFVIVGGGVAGTTAARNLRGLDPSAAVAILGDEPYPYYYRPRLWELIAGRIERRALYFREADWYAAQGIDLRLNASVAEIQAEAHTVKLTTGETLPFDRLLIAAGADSYLPGIPGVDLPGVYTLRTIRDAEAIRARAAESRRAVVVGGGLLGLETADSLRGCGLEVSVVEILPHLLPRQLDREGGDFLQALLESAGLKFRTGVKTAAVTGDGSAAGIRLEDGGEIGGELVLFSTGVVPRTELARAAGIAVHSGIAVDAAMQTSAADIFAAGDCAEVDGRTYGLIPPAIEQARAASQNMAGGTPAKYHGTLPAATLKLMGMDLTSLGEATAEDPSLAVYRVREESARCYKKIAVRNGVIVGAILLNDATSVPWIKQLIAARRDVSQVEDRLLDRAFDLKGFAEGKPVEPAPDGPPGGPG
ncbi:MAG: NAD(P)/FAD-dependent oxidoreductase [Anaerolineales bacterium]|nr:NAD(P)/FAD-dependent oxidoreductase [Anaerolineales bacterium]